MPRAEELLNLAQQQREEPPPADVYLGGRPEEDEDQLRKERERAADAQDTPQIRQLMEQLREQGELIAGLLKRDAARPMNELSREVAEFEAQRARAKKYQMINEKYDGVVTLQVHTHQNLNENWDVKVYINGDAFVLKRGVSYTVPVSVLEVLDNARVQSAINIVDAEGNPRKQIIDQLSYPYTILSMGKGAEH